jgi:predicted regulator of Ras-like GTPase activity (Roadblock/LC7/MglB family)
MADEVAPPIAAPASPLPPEAMISPVLPPPAVPASVPAKTETTLPPPRPLMDFGDIFGVPSKKDWTLKEVVQKCATLRGVAGAVITTADGLLVAGVWPDGVTTESAAAFMPQMFSRVCQYSRELRLGDPGQFTLLIENVPLQLFRTGNNYFTVLGKAGEPLPKVQLSALALRLAQDTTQK